MESLSLVCLLDQKPRLNQRTSPKVAGALKLLYLAMDWLFAVSNQSSCRMALTHDGFVCMGGRLPLSAYVLAYSEKFNMACLLGVPRLSVLSGGTGV